MAMEDPETGKSEYSGAQEGMRPGDGGSEGKPEYMMMNEAKHKAYAAGEHFLDEAAERARTLFYEQKQKAADELDTLADSFRQTGERLRNQEREIYARYADEIAKQVERASGYIRTREVSDLIGEVGDLVRREPVLFFGGAFAAGFLAARLFKLSGQAAQEREPYRGYPSEADSKAAPSPELDIEEESPYGVH